MTENEQHDADFTEPLEDPLLDEAPATDASGEESSPDEFPAELDSADVTVILDDGDQDIAGAIAGIDADADADADVDVDVTENMDPDVTEDMGAIGIPLVSSLPGEDGVDATEEMFVVLPDDDEIPIIDTEEVGSAEVLVGDFDPDSEPTEMDMGGHGDDASELDDLTSELDDQMVEMGTDSVDLVDGEEFPAIDDDDVLEGDFQESSGGGFKKVLVGLAALLVIGLAVYKFVPWQGELGVTPVASAGSGPGGEATTVVTTPQPVADPVDQQGEVEQIAASRRVFSEKFELALNLGFGGHVRDE